MSDLSTLSSQGPLQTLGLEQRYPKGEQIIADHLAPKLLRGIDRFYTEDGIRSTLEFLAGAAPTSRLVLTYIRQDFIDGEELHGLKILHRMVMKNDTWKWGSTESEIRTLLDRYGWEVVEHHGSDALAARFVPSGRALPSTPIEPIVLAIKR